MKLSVKNRRIFLITFCSYFAIHLYALTHQFYNWDNVNSLFGESMKWNISLGRWAKVIYLSLTGQWSLPVLRGSLSAVYLAISACVICEIFEVNNHYIYIYISIMLSAFPVVASWNMYMYMADVISLSFLLGTITIRIIISANNMKTYAIAIFVIVIAFGLYQSAISVILTLLVLYLLYKCIYENNVKIIYTLLVAVICIITAFILYYLIARVSQYLFSAVLTTYNGADTLGLVPLSLVPRRLANIYAHFILFIIGSLPFSLFGKSVDGYITAINPLNTAGNIIIIIMLFYSAFSENKKVRTRLAQVLILVLGIPLSVNALLVPTGSLHDLMRGSYVLLYIFATIIIGNKILSSNSGQPINGNNSSMENIKMKILKTVAILLAVMTCLHWVISDQKVYATAEINKTRADSYFTRLITQLEINGAIDNERSIAFIGYAPEIHYDKINYNISDSSIDYSAVPKWVLLTGLKTTNHINNPFFRDIVSYFYGIDLPKLTEEQKVKLVRKTDELLDLPIYPAYGSINIIAVDENEYLTVVKLSNEVDVVR